MFFPLNLVQSSVWRAFNSFSALWLCCCCVCGKITWYFWRVLSYGTNEVPTEKFMVKYPLFLFHHFELLVRQQLPYAGSQIQPVSFSSWCLWTNSNIKTRPGLEINSHSVPFSRSCLCKTTEGGKKKGSWEILLFSLNIREIRLLWRKEILISRGSSFQGSWLGITRHVMMLL